MAAMILAGGLAAEAQCDPMAVDFGGEPWGLAPDGVETFFDPAELGVAYTDEVHLLVPSLASQVVPDTPLDAPIDSVVISAVLLVDTISGDTLEFSEAGLEYICNNLGDCADPCTFLGGSQYCATFSGTPTVAGNYMLSLEVDVWATVFGFPLATPFSFSGFPFPIAGEVNGLGEASIKLTEVFPNPFVHGFTLQGARGASATVIGMHGQTMRQWEVATSREFVDMAEFPAGMYLLQLDGAEGRKCHRLTLTH